MWFIGSVHKPSDALSYFPYPVNNAYRFIVIYIVLCFIRIHLFVVAHPIFFLNLVLALMTICICIQI